MQCDPKNAVLPANRAMAKIKMKDWKSVENDCTLSLSLDSTYVKAYHRRGTARKNLKKFSDALKDFEKTIELEPNNKQAQAEIHEVRFLMKQQEEDIPKKEPPANKKVFDDNLKGAFKSSTSKSSVKQPLPGQVFPIDKPPHLRSSVPLKRIDIKEIGDEDEIEETNIKIPLTKTASEISKKPVIEILDTKEDKSNQSIKIASNAPKSDNLTEVKTTKSRGLTKKVESEFNESKKSVPLEENLTSPVAQTTSSPKKPTTSVQFSNGWTKLSRTDDKIAFLELLSTKDYAKIFKHSMEPEIFSSILKVLLQMSKVSNHVLGIANIPRVSAMIMFLEDDEKAIINDILQKVKSEAILSQKDMEKVQNVFQ